MSNSACRRRRRSGRGRRDFRFRLFTNSKSRCQLRLAESSVLQLGTRGRERKNIYAHNLVLEKTLSNLELFGIFIGNRQRRVRRRKTMGMHKAVDIALILRWSQRHVAIGALRGLGRVIEGARALSGNAAGLPIVVFVESANPAIVVDGRVEMDFVATGTELSRLIPHERF